MNSCAGDQSAAQIRRTLQRARRQISAAEHRKRAKQAERRATRRRMFHGCRRVAVYLPAFGELGTHALIERLVARQTQVFIPQVVGRRLFFSRLPVKSMKRLRSHRHALGMPLVKRRGWLRAEQLDAVVVPLVAFDEQCNRLGMGGGFYDRALKSARATRKVGWAHELQKLKSLPINPWDVRLHSVVTQNRVYD